MSWAPYNPATSVTAEGSNIFRIATASCDNRVRVWGWVENSGEEWKEESVSPQPHKGNYFEDIFYLCFG